MSTNPGQYHYRSMLSSARNQPHTSASISGYLSTGGLRYLSSSTGTPSPSPRSRRVVAACRPVTAPMVSSSCCQDKLPCSATPKGHRSKTPRKGQVDKVKSPRSRDRPRTFSTLLPPRKLSSVSTVDGDAVVKDERKDEHKVTPVAPPVKIDKLHFADSYTPHKRHWVKKAMEQLGTEWVRSGKIKEAQLKTSEFEEKMAVLYDLAMARKHEAIDRMVGVEEVTGGGKGKRGVKSAVQGQVQENFPFAEHLNGKVKETMSEALLRYN